MHSIPPVFPNFWMVKILPFMTLLGMVTRSNIIPGLPSRLHPFHPFHHHQKGRGRGIIGGRGWNTDIISYIGRIKEGTGEAREEDVYIW